DPDAVTVVARGPVDDVGRQAGAAGHRLVQRKGLDVRDDPERQARAVRPGDPGASIDRNIGKRPGALRLHVTYGVEPAAARRRLTSVHSAGVSGPCRKATMLSWRWAGLIVPTMFVAMSGWVKVNRTLPARLSDRNASRASCSSSVCLDGEPWNWTTSR